MRVPAGKALRVEPGDEVFITARLVPSERLGRLFVFAREATGGDFSPYVPNIANMVEGEPRLMQPMSLRLTDTRRDRRLSFVSDIDGFICVMQEVDTAKDPLVKIRMKRKICPQLGWREWLHRKMTVFFPWQNTRPA